MVLCGLLSPPRLLRAAQPLAIGPGSISAAGQKNSPRQITTVDHNRAAAAKRPHQDAALMKRCDGDLTRERSLQTPGQAHAKAHAHIIQSHKLFFFSFGKHEQLDKALM